MIKASFAVRILVCMLIVSLILPLPMSGMAATSVRADAASGKSNVFARLNSPERARAIEDARRTDAAAREAFAGEEGRARQGAGGKNTTFTQGGSEQLEESNAPLWGGFAGQPPFAASSRPKSVTEVLFNGVTGLMGLPGLAGDQSDLHDPYGANFDQGLGFHQDGSARRADGSTGNAAANAHFDGRRADSYAGSGLGYSPGGDGFAGYDMGADGFSGYSGAAYGPVTGYSGSSNDPVRGGRRGSGYDSGGMFDSFDLQQYFFQRGLNYGMGWANSLGEAAFTSLTDTGRARLNFMVDQDGRVNGEGDVLYPFYDGQYTTVFTQVGARTMSGISGGGKDGRGADRWIGNFGLGQRWYPGAAMGRDGETVDSGQWMFGYNAFFDNDFTRSHQRGGLGLEIQYDFVQLASNYYVPLSSWKSSRDFDSDFVEERPAEGWDIRAKGYLPFYRNLAVTGAYSQWQGDHVGMFNSSKLEKDPRVWSYGLEYTPIPLVSGFVNQRSTEQGRSDTEFGLRMTYRFDMPWDQQTSHAKVAELRTVGAGRHEFVDRENRIILEYRAKNNFHIEYLGMVDTNQFKFRIRNGFDEYVAGQVVNVSADGGVTLAEAKAPAPASFLARAGEFIVDMFSVKAAHAANFTRTYTTDGNGEFIVRLDSVISLPVVVNLQAGNTRQSFTLAGATITSNMTLVPDSPFNVAVGGTSALTSFTLQDNGIAVTGQKLALSWGGTGAFDSPPASGVTTDGAGKFTLSNLKGLSAGTVTLGVSLADGRTASCELVITASSLTLAPDSPFSVAVGSTEALTGFTLQDNGVAVAGQTLTLSWGGTGTFDNPPTAGVTTDGSGKFSLSNLKGLTAGTATLTVTLPDGRAAPCDLTITASGLALALDNPFSVPVGGIVPLTGFTLQDNGVALAGQTLTLSWSGTGAFDSPPTAGVTTDGSGKFSLANLKGLSAGSVTLTVALPDGRTAGCNLTIVASSLALALDTPFSAPVGGTVPLTGFTLQDNGVAVAGQTLTLSWGGTGAFDSPPTAGVTTDGAGKFSLANLKGLSAGSVTLTVALPDGRTAVCSLTVVTSNLTLAPDSPFSVPVGSTVPLTGFTLQDNGVAVAGQTLTLSWSGTGAFDSPPTAGVTTDGSGKFSLANLKGLSAGSVTLSVTLPDGRTALCNLTVVASNLTLAPDSPFSVPVGGTVPLTGFTLQDNGVAVTGATLALSWSGTGAFDSPPTAGVTTDGSGKFSLANLKGLSAGSVTLTVTFPDGRTAVCNLTVVASNLTLASDSPFSVPVGGTVAMTSFTLQDSGVAVTGTALALSWSGTGAFDSPPTAGVTTDGSGKFSLANLKGLSAGSVTLTVTLPDGRTTLCNLTVVASNLTLAPDSPFSVAVGGTVALTSFTLQDNGVALTGMALALSWSGAGAFASPPTAGVTTDGSGKFSLANLKGLTAGSATLSVTLPDGRTTLCNLAIIAPLPVTDIVTDNSPADNSSLNKVRARFLQADGVTPMADGTIVNWALPAVPAGVVLSTTTSSIAGGQGWAEMTLKDGQIGDRNVVVRASYGTIDRDITVHFGTPVFLLSNMVNGTPNPAIGGDSLIAVDVAFSDSTSAANLPASIVTWTTRNNASASALPTTATSGTNAAAQASFTAASSLQHTMYVEAKIGTNSQNTTVQFGPALAPGFISGWTPGNAANWQDAVSFCTNQGGHLPLIGGSTSIPQTTTVTGYTVEGFGSIGATWPAGVDTRYYWTGTEVSGQSSSWVVYPNASGGSNLVKDGGDVWNTPYFSAICVQ